MSGFRVLTNSLWELAVMFLCADCLLLQRFPAPSNSLPVQSSNTAGAEVVVAQANARRDTADRPLLPWAPRGTSPHASSPQTGSSLHGRPNAKANCTGISGHLRKLMLLEGIGRSRAASADGWEGVRENTATRQLLADMGRLEDQYEAARVREGQLERALLGEQSRIAAAVAEHQEAVRLRSALEAYAGRLKVAVACILLSGFLLFGVHLARGVQALAGQKPSRWVLAQPVPLAAQPEPAKPEPARSEPAEPRPARPEPAQPEPARPKPAQPVLPGTQLELPAAQSAPAQLVLPVAESPPVQPTLLAVQAGDAVVDAVTESREKCEYYSLADDTGPLVHVTGEDWWSRDERAPRCCF
mmetsp:Transcript_74781/g.173201  ORF Transcript_74781/g.173201 Transcript_74781/m.173201 type:complete len:357 (+) Transcript_74781:75-1145(+)